MGQDLRPELDASRLATGGLGTGVVLVFSAWIGVAIGTVVTGITSGPITAIAVFFNGLWAAPAFGFVFGAIGLRSARDRVLHATGSRPVDASHPLSVTVGRLAERLNVPKPYVGIHPDEDLNAYACGSGPGKAAVSFTRGLVDRMPEDELAAIAAHELAHIVNNDMRRMQWALSFQRSLTWYLAFTERGQSLARWLLGPVGELMIMKLSRTREYWADATAAALVGPDKVIAALERLHTDPVVPSAERLAYARLMIRANPASWFATHPPLEDRIAAVRNGTYTNRLPYRGRPAEDRDPRFSGIQKRLEGLAYAPESGGPAAGP